MRLSKPIFYVSLLLASSLLLRRECCHASPAGSRSNPPEQASPPAFSVVAGMAWPRHLPASAGWIAAGLFAGTSLLVLRQNSLKSARVRHWRGESNRLKKQLEQQRDDLLNLEKMAVLGRLTSDIAHEIKNPLNFLAATAPALQSDIDELRAILQRSRKTGDPDTEFLLDEIDELIRSVNLGVERIAGLTRNLRLFARHDGEEWAAANLHAALDSALSILNHRMRERITVHRDFGALPPVTCRIGRLNQVFLNVLDNAVQSIEEKGDIYLHTRVAGRQAIISIRDTGGGMEEAVRRRIFERSFTTKPAGEGTGLGLAISREIIEEHRGAIEVRSTPGAGAEFIISIPLHHE